MTYDKTSSSPLAPEVVDHGPSSALETVQALLDALSSGGREAALSFYDESVEQREFPNRLVNQGAQRGLRELVEGAERGKKVVSDERYIVRNAIVSGDRVAVEVDWSATLKVPFGSVPAGGTLRASCGIFFTVRNGRIVQQHNYDCFEPF